MHTYFGNGSKYHVSRSKSQNIIDPAVVAQILYVATASVFTIFLLSITRLFRAGGVTPKYARYLFSAAREMRNVDYSRSGCPCLTVDFFPLLFTFRVCVGDMPGLMFQLHMRIPEVYTLTQVYVTATANSTCPSAYVMTGISTE